MHWLYHSTKAVMFIQYWTCMNLAQNHYVHNFNCQIMMWIDDIFFQAWLIQIQIILGIKTQSKQRSPSIVFYLTFSTKKTPGSKSVYHFYLKNKKRERKENQFRIWVLQHKVSLPHKLIIQECGSKFQ